MVDGPNFGLHVILEVEGPSEPQNWGHLPYRIIIPILLYVLTINSFRGHLLPKVERDVIISCTSPV